MTRDAVKEKEIEVVDKRYSMDAGPKSKDTKIWHLTKMYLRRGKCSSLCTSQKLKLAGRKAKAASSLALCGGQYVDGKHGRITKATHVFSVPPLPGVTAPNQDPP